MTRNLYDDVDAMLEVADLIYIMADLGKAKKDDAKVGAMTDSGFLDTLPKTSKEVVQWAVKNKEVMGNADNSKSYLEDILARDQKQASADATLEVFDDDFAYADEDSEVVYGIGKNPDMKRITVVFRGSTTSADWEHNCKCSSEELEEGFMELLEGIPSVNAELASEFKDVRLHTGFSKYLFKNCGKNAEGVECEKPKFHQIVDHVRRLLEENPDYELWFTGHSLGGALAVLAASAAALLDDIKTTVKLVSFAAPQVGKENYVKIMDRLESTKALIHIRVTNCDDLVPQLNGVIGYEHFGLHLNLYKNRHALSYDQGGMSRPWFWNALNRHSMTTHNARLTLAKSDLEKYDIDTVCAKIREEKTRNIDESPSSFGIVCSYMSWK
uniref:Fungal lipase-type domain-containing protein n=1 Tax=Ditylum brightwellii TaxID=49249 RepID=A0A7S1ZG03_9STRA|mmetsp:Transcript_30926/g.46114  ORF Transcript_30926/g.46114 Transcript_30926/m.46114 type:complete len:384 (+) Transcript_30926:19-1170(+)